MSGSMGWIRRNTTPTGRVIRGVAGGALVASSFLVDARWAKVLTAALGGALAMEAATGYCPVSSAVAKLGEDSRTQDSI